MADIFGTPGDDNLVGTPDPDFISGEGGDDTITALEGDDTVDGGDGNDVIDLGDGFDFAYGRAGDDMIRGGAGNDHLYGELDSDTQLGISGDDLLFGGEGDDFMRGGLGNDYLDGGSGSDRVSYFDALGSVTIDLRIQGVAQNTGHGMDTLVNVENTTGSTFADVLIGNNQANWFWSHGGADVITGNAGDDTIWTPQGDGADVHGGQGVDVISFTGRVDPLDIGGITIDLSIQGSAQDTLRGLITLRSIEGAEGSEFDDVIDGNSRDNILSGRAGADVINGGGGDDLIQGDIPIRLVGEQAFDFNDPSYIHGDDVLNGDGGNDAIYGDRGNDTINGGAGDDTIVGGEGADHLTGGGGADQFVYASASESTSVNFDTIVGFNFNGVDSFDLPVAVTTVTQVIGGTLDAATFDANLSIEMNAGVLSASEAVLFTPTAGSYAGERFLIVDGNGVAGYQAGEDFVFLMDSAVKVNFFDAGDFF